MPPHERRPLACHPSLHTPPFWQAKIGELLQNAFLGGHVEWTLERMMQIEVQDEDSGEVELKYVWDVHNSSQACCTACSPPTLPPPLGLTLAARRAHRRLRCT